MAGRRFRRIGATLVTMVGLGLIAALCTGEVALVTTHGISMEPRFSTGDLAAITPSAHYRVGEIVGYHSPLLHIVVLHRIVAEHAGLFTFKGDNNSFLDPVRLPASAIEGRLWLHIPRGGVVLGWLRSPVVMGILAFLVVALGIGGTARRRRHRGAGVGMAAAPERASSHTVGVQWWPVAVALALVGLTGMLTLSSWTRPTTRPSETAVAYAQSTRFSYAGNAPAGVTYPTGTVTTGDPVFLHLVNRLEVSALYTLTPSGKSTVPASGLAVRGTIGATATVEAPGGWTAPLAQVAPLSFSGPSASVGLTLDLTQIPGLEQAFVTETGVPLVDPEIVVTPVVHVRGTMAGAPVRDGVAPTLTFRVDGESLDVVGTSDGGTGSGGGGMDVVRQGAVERRITVPAHMSLLGRSTTVATFRRLALGGLLLSGLAALCAWGWMVRRRRMDEAGRIRATYGHDLVAVSASPAPRARLVVEVETFAQLAHLARRYDCVILEHAHSDGHAYYVESGATIYRCGVEVPDEVDAGSTDDSGILDEVAVPAAELSTVPASGARRGRGWSRPAGAAVDGDDGGSGKAATDVELLTCLAKAEWVSGVGDPAGHLHEAVALARKAGLDEMMTEALLVNVRSAFDEDQPCDLEKIELLEETLSSLGEAPGLRARVLGSLAVELVFVGDAARRAGKLDEARTLAARSRDALALVDVATCHYFARPRASWSAAQFSLDRAQFGHALDEVALLGDPFWVAPVQSVAAAYAVIAGDGPELRAQAAALEQTSSGGRSQVAERAGLLLRQIIATMEGRLAEAEDLSAVGFDLRRRTGLAEAEKVRAVELVGIRREQGRLAEVADLLRELSETKPRSGAAAAAVAFAEAETGRWDDAATRLSRAAEDDFGDVPDDADWPVAVALWAEVTAQVGDVTAAAALHDLLEPVDGLNLYADGIACGPVSRLLAVLEHVLDRPSDADRHFAEAIAFGLRLGSPVWTARSALDWAETLIARPETVRAGELIDNAERIMAGLDLPALRQRVADLRARLDHD